MYWSDIDYIAPRITPRQASRKILVRSGGNGATAGRDKTVIRPGDPPVAVNSTPNEVVQPTADEPNWHEIALRLQAEMDNFRKRQERRAEEVVTAERERLLSIFLPVVDNLARALNHGEQTNETVRQGVELTYRELVRLLEAEGVTRLETVGQPFDPNWHEATGVIPAEVEPDTIVAEIEAGYRLGDRLLRPAKVLVAA